MNFNKLFLAVLSAIVVMPNAIFAMDQEQAEEKQQAESKADFAQQMPEQQDALDQEINAYTDDLAELRAKQEKEQAERKEVNTKRATNKKTDNKIPWKKVAANGTAMGYSYFCGYVINKFLTAVAQAHEKSNLGIFESLGTLTIVGIIATSPFAMTDALGIGEQSDSADYANWLAVSSVFAGVILTN